MLKHVLTFIVKKLVSSETRALSFVIITTKSSFDCPCTFITQNITTLLKQKNEQLDCKINCIVGIVHVYHVPQERDLQNLDLRKNIAISLDCEHINAIAIGDDGSRPVIAVATDVVGVIHVIRW